MMRRLALAVALACCLLQHVAADKKVLVLLQDVAWKASYSSFFGLLESHGFEIDYKGYKDSSVKLRNFDQWHYDHLVIFAPKAEGFGGDVSQQAILDFVDAGHNVIMAGSSDISETILQLGTEFGVDFDDKGTAVYDHFSFAATDGKQDHTLIASDVWVNSSMLVGSPKAPVLFRGVALTVPPESELVTVALSAPRTAYSHDKRKSLPEPPLLVAGSAAALITATQARNNARVVVTGSVEVFSNDLLDAAVTVASTGKTYAKSGNAEVAEALALWAFQQRGVLVAEGLRHHIVGQEGEPELYRVGDDVEVMLEIFEVVDGQRLPYKADDVQIEFTMLHPYVRLTLQHDGQGTYWTQFKVPDVYGVFKYTVDYQHLGYSYLHLLRQVPVRPFKHNEYPRFLTAAYPYYASAFASMAAFFLVGVFFLYHK